MSLKINRRGFLYSSAASIAGLALAACAKPQVATPAAQAATALPPTAPPPTAVPTQRPLNTPVPTKPPATMVPTAMPAREAPMLAELVKAGKLPPLVDRLPKNPLTLKPAHKTGKYGGTMRIFQMNLGNPTQEMMYGHSPLRWLDEGLNIGPGMCDSWSPNADNSEWTLHIREGLKWSDGVPVSVDDILFVYNDLVLNPDQSDTITDFYANGGVPVEMIKVDDYTVKLKYAGPAPLTVKRLTMWVKAGIGPRWIAPAHYLKAYHPTYNPTVKDYVNFDQRIVWRQNPACPHLSAWGCERYEPGIRRVWVRNPYYYCLDTDGNQLPYIDRIEETNIEDKEVQLLTVLQGGVDYLCPVIHRFSLADAATLRAGEKDGKYRTVLLDTVNGTGHGFYWNYDCADPKYRELYRNPKFKQAFHYLRDRERIRTTLYYGLGELTTGTMSPRAIEYNFNDEAREWYRKVRDAYVEFDPAKATQLLDELGLKDVDNDGLREFPDGGKLTLRLDCAEPVSAANQQGLDITVADFAKVGLKMVKNGMPTAEYNVMHRAGQSHIDFGAALDGPDHLVYPLWWVPVTNERWAPLCGNYYTVKGTPQATAEKDVDPWKRTPPRWIEGEQTQIGDPVVKLFDLLDRATVEVDAIKRMQMVWQMHQVHIDSGMFGSGSVASVPVIFVYGDNLINLPVKEDGAMGNLGWIIPTPATHNPETFSFK